MTNSRYAAALPTRILVWDSPTRIFHWILAICFAGAMITQDMERLRLVHNTFGYTMLGLVGFRLIWGIVGTRYARFRSFVPSPRQVMGYLRSLIQQQPMHSIGHNPIGALGILAMLALTVGVAVSGMVLDQGIAEELMEEVHEVLANLLLIVVGIHVLGVVMSSITHKENLVGAMISGYKTGTAAQGIRSPLWWIGIPLALAVVGFWAFQFGVISG